VTIRDFSDAHADFEDTTGTDKGIVTNQLGSNGKPEYFTQTPYDPGDNNTFTPTTHGVANFNEWYVTGPNNVQIDQQLQLTNTMGNVWEFSSNSFFPIDNLGLGNEGRNHNFHFTLEMNTNFQYLGGEVFSFTGDDDLFVYIDGQRVINLGGVHGAQSASVNLDTLGLTPGAFYDLDFFFAERHTTQSNFQITTTISCFKPQ